MSGGIGLDIAPKSVGDVNPIRTGMLGYASIGQAHAKGYRTPESTAWPPTRKPRLVPSREETRGSWRKLRRGTAWSALQRTGRSLSPTPTTWSSSTAADLTTSMRKPTGAGAEAGSLYL